MTHESNIIINYEKMKDDRGMTPDEVKGCIAQIKSDYPPNEGFVYIVSNGDIIDERSWKYYGTPKYVNVYIKDSCTYYYSPPYPDELKTIHHGRDIFVDMSIIIIFFCLS